MTATQVEIRLRQFLFGLAVALCVGSMVELSLVGHLQQPIQWAPYILCSLGLVAAVTAWARPTRLSLWGLRGVMSAMALGGAFGSFQHLQSNLEILRETKPGLTIAAALWQAMHGAAPLLAPGVLTIAAVVALMATYGHPTLSPRHA